MKELVHAKIIHDPPEIKCGDVPTVVMSLDIEGGTLKAVDLDQSPMDLEQLCYRYDVSLTLPKSVEAIADGVFRDKMLTVSSTNVIKFIGEEAFAGANAGTLHNLRIDSHTEVGSRCFYRMLPEQFSYSVRTYLSSWCRPGYGVTLPPDMTADQIRLSSVLVHFYPDRVFEVATVRNRTYHNLEPWLMSLPTVFNTVVCATEEQKATVTDMFYPKDVPDGAVFKNIIVAPYVSYAELTRIVQLPHDEFDIDAGAESRCSSDKNLWRFVEAYDSHRLEGLSVYEIMELVRKWPV